MLQNQVSARRLELNKIIFRQIAPTLYDLVVFKETENGQDENDGYSKIWIKAILGDPGADSGGEGKSKQAEKYGTKEK